MFQATPNTENFQARYVITHPASGNFNCEAGRKYLADLRQRRHDELKMLTYLTGKGYDDWDVVANTKEEKNIPTDISYKSIASTINIDKKDNRPLFATLGVIGLIALFGFRQRRVRS
jgi:hypothetical protein